MARIEEKKFIAEVILEDERLSNFFVSFLQKYLKQNRIFSSLRPLLSEIAISSLNFNIGFEYDYRIERVVWLESKKKINWNKISKMVLKNLGLPGTKEELEKLRKVLKEFKEAFNTYYSNYVLKTFEDFFKKYGLGKVYDRPLDKTLKIGFSEDKVFEKFVELKKEKFISYLEREILSSESIKQTIESFKRYYRFSILFIFRGYIFPELETEEFIKRICFLSIFPLVFVEVVKKIYESKQFLLKDFIGKPLEEGLKIARELRNLLEDTVALFPISYVSYLLENYKEDILKRLGLEK